MSLRKLFGLLDDIKYDSSRTNKEKYIKEILADHNISNYFISIVEYVYNPYVHIGVNVTNDLVSARSNTRFLDSAIIPKMNQLISVLSSSLVTGDAARDEVCKFFSEVPHDLKWWLKSILNKDLKIGVGSKTIEKLLPGVVPNFGLQLCKKYPEGVDPKYPHIIQPKVDGLRGVFVVSGGNVQVFSRTGKPLYNVDHVSEELKSISDGHQLVFDGELFANDWKSSMAILRSSKADKSNVAKNLKFYVFDVVQFDQWYDGKCKLKLSDRSSFLSSLVMNKSLENLVCVPSIYCSKYSEIVELTKNLVDDGYEGSVIKDPESYYTFKRDNSWRKFKFFKETDAVIKNVKLGWINSFNNSIIDYEEINNSDYSSDSWELIVRSLIVDPGFGIETDVGSGLTLEDKRNFFNLHDSNNLIGRKVEVKYHEITDDKKLLHPRFTKLL